MNTKTHAYEFIRNRLTTGAWPPGTRMPPLHELARLCGVSRATMWKALSLAKDESLLHTKKGGAIFAGVESSLPQATSRDENLLWERTKTRIGRDLLTGPHTASALPPINKLALRYGVATATLKKALESLTHDGLVKKNGNHRYPAGQRATYQRSVMLISSAGSSAELIVGDDYTKQMSECLERECHSSGLASIHSGFDAQSDEGLRNATKLTKSYKTLEGFVISLWNPWDEAVWQRHAELFSFLVSLRLPVITIDLSGNCIFPSFLLKHPFFRVIRKADHHAGRKVADALYHRGHKNVAFVALDARNDWVLTRYESVRQYYAKYAGNESAVEFFAPEMPVSNYELMAALLDLDEKGVRAIHAGHYTNEQIQGFVAALGKIRKMGLKKMLPNDVVSQTLKPVLHCMESLVNKEHDPRSFYLFQQTISRMASDHGLLVYLSPLFVQMLENSNATAWICANDQTAIAALSFLRRRNIPVPKKISVIGFDNWQVAYEYQLSTYDFNIYGMTQQAFLMIRDKKAFANAKNISEVVGYVVERRTTRR